MDAIFYILKAGCSWHLLPKDFPPYKTVYDYFQNWKKSGFWQLLNRALNQVGRRKVGKKSSPSLIIIDSQSVKGKSGKQENKGIDGYKKVNGRKRHLVVDTLGQIVGCYVTAANVHDSKACEFALEESYRNSDLRRCKKVLADKGYRGNLEFLVPIRFGIELEIGSKSEKHGFSPRPKRWIVERTIAWINAARRLSKDYEQTATSSAAWIYIANIKLVLGRLEKSL